MSRPITNRDNMILCETACATAPKKYPSAGCAIQTRQGGIYRLVFFKCNFSFTDPTDIAEWEAGITAGNIVVSGEILGDKPRGTATKKKLSSGRPEQKTGISQVINFQDYNLNATDAVEDQPTYLFWEDKDKNHTKYNFGYFDFEENFFGIFSQISLEVDDEIEQDINGNAFISGTVSYNKKFLTVPVNIPGINATL